MFNLPIPSPPWYPRLPLTRWSPPEQNAHPPSLGEGPSPENKITPTVLSSFAEWKASNNSKTVLGRKAFLTSGRLKAILITPFLFFIGNIFIFFSRFPILMQHY